MTNEPIDSSDPTLAAEHSQQLSGQAVPDEILHTVRLQRAWAAEGRENRKHCSAAAAPLNSEEPLAMLGQYQLLGEIARGGMGIIYRARQPKLNRVVALKVTRAGLLQSADEARRFQVEASAAARLDHPNIVPIYEVGQENGQHFFSMALIEGQNLAEATASGPLPPRRAAALVKQLADAVAYAHGQGVIHRDLKPSNILLDAAGQPRITDFGLAKSTESDSGLTQAGEIMGTPAFMPPEQAQGDMKFVGPAADVYGLGATLYCLVTGRPPFQAATALETMQQVLEREPVSPRYLNPAVDRDLDTICLKCLQKRPERRYSSAAALAGDLQRFLENKPIEARPVSPLEKLARWRRRNPLVAASLAAVAATFLTAFVLITRAYLRVDDALQEEAKQRQEAQQREKAERWERYRANMVAAMSALQVSNAAAARRALEAAPEEYRNWEWRHFHKQLDVAAHVLRSEEPSANNAIITPNGARVVMEFPDANFRIWDPAARKQVRSFPVAPELIGAAWSPDGRVVACRVNDGSVHLRDIEAERPPRVLRGHRGVAHSIHFSPDSTHVATSGQDHTAHVWNARTGALEHTIRHEEADVAILDISAGGRRLITLTSATHMIRVWDVATGAAIGSWPGAEHTVIGAQFGPSGDCIVLADGYPSNLLWLWRPKTEKSPRALPGHTNQRTALDFSPDGTRFASASYDATVRFWDAVTGDCIAVLKGHRGWVLQVRFSPDGKRLVSCAQDQAIRVWDATSGAALAVLHGHSDEIFAVDYVAGGDTIVSAARDGAIRMWDVRTIENDGVLRGHSKFVYGVAFHPDGARVASASWDGTVRLWDATSGRQLALLDHGEKNIVASVAIHAEGKLLASVARDDTIRLWDIDAGELVHAWNAPTTHWRDTRVALSARTNLLAAGDRDGAVHLWDIATKMDVAVLRGHGAHVRDVAFSPDDRWLVSAADGDDPVVRVWDMKSKAEAHVLKGHTAGVYALAFNKTGSLLASGSTDGTLRLWDTAAWKEVAVLRHGHNIYGLAFSPDGTRLASACADNSIRFWDVEKRQEVAELRGHDQYVHALAFSPDGTRLVSASGDTTLRVWDTLSSLERLKEASPAPSPILP